MTRVIIVSGLSRSGTTLLERLLGELPGVVALGGASLAWQRTRHGGHCGCGEPWRRCGFWHEVGQVAFGGWETVDVDRMLTLRQRVERVSNLPGLVLRRPMPEALEYAGALRRIYAAARRVAGARVVVDTARHSTLPWSLRQSTGLDLRVVHLVRDPRAVAHAGTRSEPSQQPGGSSAEHLSPTTAFSAAVTALRWNTHNAALSVLARTGVSVFRLRYEELVAEPTTMLRALVSFAGVGASADLGFVGRSTVTLGPSHSVAGEPPAFSVLPLRPDGDRWRHDLAPRLRRLIGAVCAPLLPAYGYPLWAGGNR